MYTSVYILPEAYEEYSFKFAICLFNYIESLMDKYNVGFFNLSVEFFLPSIRFYWGFIEDANTVFESIDIKKICTKEVM